jgi:hypothetical protein
MKSMFGIQHNKTDRNMIGQSFVENEWKYTIEHLNAVDEKYTNYLATRDYDNIPCDLIEYSILYEKIKKISLKTNNQTMQLLFKISLQGLTGAVNAFHLNNKHVHSNLEILQLQNKLTNINIHDVCDNTEKSLKIMQSFTLAPLYSYYILLFGIPKKGFEPDKINKIIETLNQYGIDPYK